MQQNFIFTQKKSRMSYFENCIPYWGSLFRDDSQKVLYTFYKKMLFIIIHFQKYKENFYNVKYFFGLLTILHQFSSQECSARPKRGKILVKFSLRSQFVPYAVKREDSISQHSKWCENQERSWNLTTKKKNCFFTYVIVTTISYVARKLLNITTSNVHGVI